MSSRNSVKSLASKESQDELTKFPEPEGNNFPLNLTDISVKKTLEYVQNLTNQESFNHIYAVDTNVIFGNPQAINQLAGNDNKPNLILLSDVNRRELNGLKKSENIARALDASTTLKGIQGYFRSGENTIIGDDLFNYGLKFKNGSHLILIPYSSEIKNLYPQTREDFGGDDQLIACSLGVKNILNKENEKKFKFITNDFDVETSCDFYKLPHERFDELFSVLEDTGFRTINLNSYNFKSVEETIFDPSSSEIQLSILEDIVQDKFYQNEFIRFVRGEKKSKHFRVKDHIITKHFRYFSQFNKKKNKLNFNPDYIPNEQQECLLELICDPLVDVIRVCGGAGSGKTITPLIAALAMQEEIKNCDSRLMGIMEIITCKPPLRTGYVGTVPGDKNDKLRNENNSIIDSMRYLYQEGKKSNPRHMMEEKIIGLMSRGLLSFETYEEITGRSLHSRFVLFDESQNYEARDSKKLVSRIGNNSKGIFSGDLGQIENPKCSKSRNALVYIHSKLKGHSNYGSITLSQIARSRAAESADKYL